MVFRLYQFMMCSSSVRDGDDASTTYPALLALPLELHLQILPQCSTQDLLKLGSDIIPNSKVIRLLTYLRVDLQKHV